MVSTSGFFFRGARIFAVALRTSIALAVALTVSGCSSAPNTQYLPIGQRCSSDSACGTSPYGCTITGHPGGYCTRSCATDADCPLDSICQPTLLACRRKCTDDSECRETEGYACIQVDTADGGTTGATSPYCDVKGS